MVVRVCTVVVRKRALSVTEKVSGKDIPNEKKNVKKKKKPINVFDVTAAAATTAGSLKETENMRNVSYRRCINAYRSPFRVTLVHTRMYAEMIVLSINVDDVYNNIMYCSAYP